MGRKTEQMTVRAKEAIQGRAGDRALAKRMPVRAVVAGLGLALATAGCMSSSSASPAPSKATYDMEANAICMTFKTKLTSLGATLSNSSDAAQTEAALTSAISLGQKGTDKLEALRRPTGESAALAQAYKAQEGEVTDIKNVLLAVKANSASQVQSALAVGQASDASMSQQFGALGLTACESSSSSSGSPSSA